MIKAKVFLLIFFFSLGLHNSLSSHKVSPEEEIAKLKIEIQKLQEDVTTLKEKKKTKSELISLNFLIGMGMSRYSTESNINIQDKNAFSEVGLQVGVNGYAQLLSKQLRIVGEVLMGQGNVETQAMEAVTNPGDIIRNATTINIDLGLQWHFLSSFNFQSLYVKGVGGMIIPAHENVKDSFLGTSFVGLGLMTFDQGILQNSYLEVGWGISGNFDNNEYGRLKLNGKAIINSGTGWSIFISGKLDVAKGPDDFNVQFGLQRDIEFLAEIVLGIFGQS